MWGIRKWMLKHSKRPGFGSSMGHIRGKNNEKCFKLVFVCQAVTEKAQIQLWQNFAVAYYYEHNF